MARGQRESRRPRQENSCVSAPDDDGMRPGDNRRWNRGQPFAHEFPLVMEKTQESLAAALPGVVEMQSGEASAREQQLSGASPGTSLSVIDARPPIIALKQRLTRRGPGGLSAGQRHGVTMTATQAAAGRAGVCRGRMDHGRC